MYRYEKGSDMTDVTKKRPNRLHSDLHRAALYGHLKVFQDYFQSTASTTTQLRHENSVYLYEILVHHGHLEILKYLVEEAPKYKNQPLDFQKFSSLPVLQRAASRHQLPMIRYLIEEVSNATDLASQRLDIGENQEKFLMVAIQEQNEKLIRYRIEDAPKFRQSTAVLQAENSMCLQIAISKNQLSTLRYLIETAPKFCEQPASLREAFLAVLKRHRLADLSLDILRYCIRDATKFQQPQIQFRTSGEMAAVFQQFFREQDTEFIRYLLFHQQELTDQLFDLRLLSSSTLEYIQPVDSNLYHVLQQAQKNWDLVKDLGFEAFSEAINAATKNMSASSIKMRI
jgi:hypothetical protein